MSGTSQRPCRRRRPNPAVAPAAPAWTLRPMPDDTSPPAGEFLLYQADDGTTRIECRVEQGTVWLSQALIADLFQKDVRTINEHLQNIFEDGELDPGATIRKFRIVRQEEGVRAIESCIHGPVVEAA